MKDLSKRAGTGGQENKKDESNSHGILIIFVVETAG